MSGLLDQWLQNEDARLDAFPVCKERVFLGHAGVTALPKCVADAVVDYTRRSSENHQEFGSVLRDVQEARSTCARFIGAHTDEISLLGPTSLGLSLFANGIDWRAGDEVLCYGDDYPANVYPWLNLRRRGVLVRFLKPERPGEITPALVESELRPETRLVALASCHFLGGFRIEVDAMGAMLHKHGVLFSLDAIQTLGASPLSVANVDFLSADAHKWMLGPLAIGIVFVRRDHFPLVRPTLLGAWNVRSPDFIAQDEIVFPDTGQRYEPGVLNIAGIYGMKAAQELILEVGLDRIAARLLSLKRRLLDGVLPLGFESIGAAEGPNASGITTLRHPRADMDRLFCKLEEARVVASLRMDRFRTSYIRFSPHFYNTEAEIDLTVEILRKSLA